MSQPRTPAWMTAVIAVCMLPVLGSPALLDLCPADSPLKTFIWFYPLYVPAAGICAWMCYPSRRELSWILLILLLLTHAAIWGAVLLNKL